MRPRYNSHSLVRTLRKTSQVVANNSSLHSHHMASSHLADTLHLAALADLMGTSSVLQAAFLPGVVPSQEVRVDRLARSVCRRRSERLQVGSRQAKASTSPLAHLPLACPLALLVYITRTNLLKDHGV
jgi:hypothetical protein